MTKKPTEVKPRQYVKVFNVRGLTPRLQLLQKNQQNYALVGMAETWMGDIECSLDGSVDESATQENVQRRWRRHGKEQSLYTSCYHTTGKIKP